jgi:hypothetical protein
VKFDTVVDDKFNGVREFLLSENFKIKDLNYFQKKSGDIS